MFCFVCWLGSGLIFMRLGKDDLGDLKQGTELGVGVWESGNFLVAFAGRDWEIMNYDMRGSWQGRDV